MEPATESNNIDVRDEDAAGVPSVHEATEHNAKRKTQLCHAESADANSIRGVLWERGVPSLHETTELDAQRKTQREGFRIGLESNGVPFLDETTELDAERKTLREGFPIGLCSQIFHETADANREVSSPLACNKIESNNMNLDHQESEDANSIRGVSSHSSSQSSVLSERWLPSLDETIYSFLS